MVDLLIIGMGNMGSLHAKYASLLRANWKWWDPEPSIPTDARRLDEFPKYLGEFSHIIIASPAITHSFHLKGLEDFDGFILVEKPGVMEEMDLKLLDDPRVSVGLVERFNPAFETLRAQVDSKHVLNVDFVRCSARPVSRIKENSFFDVGLHDIDLLGQLFPDAHLDHMAVYSTSNTFCLMGRMSTGQVVRFIWSNETFHKERVIKVRESYCNYECNLIDQTVSRFSLSSDNKNTIEEMYVEKASPLRCELESFFAGNRVESRASHEVFLEVLAEIKRVHHVGDVCDTCGTTEPDHLRGCDRRGYRRVGFKGLE